MGGGQGAKRRSNLRKAREKQKLKRAAKEAAKAAGLVTIDVPTVTEDDLLAFQASHFGDDGKPEAWVIDADTALDYDPAAEDDGLGYYEDGVKRTLTDEQIEMFRHTEIELLRREERLRGVSIADQSNESVDIGQMPEAVESITEVEKSGTTAPVECADTITELETSKSSTQPTQQLGERLPSESSRSNSSASTGPGRKRQRQQKDIPYDQRHKRKWEQYIERKDPVEGSMTENRLARQLDERQEESIELDY